MENKIFVFIASILLGYVGVFSSFAAENNEKLRDEIPLEELAAITYVKLKVFHPEIEKYIENNSGNRTVKFQKKQIENDFIVLDKEPNSWSNLYSLWVNTLIIKQKNNEMKKLNNEPLFEIFLLFLRNHATEYMSIWNLPYFDADLINANIDLIMKPFIEGRFSYYYLSEIPFSEANRKKYQSFIDRVIQDAKDEYKTPIPDTEKREYMQNRILYSIAKLGDRDAKNALIENFKNHKWKKLSNDQDGSRLIIQLISLGSRETITTVLEIFKENIGAPQYFVGASQRYLILSCLMGNYLDEPFFQKYKYYLGYNNETSYFPLDESIGGEEGVQKLFKEFQQWVKEKFDYDLDLTGAEYKINIAYESIDFDRDDD